VDSEPAIILGIPVLVLLSRTRSDDVSRVLHKVTCKGAWDERWRRVAYLGIRLDLKPPRTQMTLTPERVDWRRVILSNLLLLSVVSHAHSDVVIAGATVLISGENIG